jgi:hypothetical protein
VTGAFFPFLKSINITISNEKIQFEAKNISDEKKKFLLLFFAYAPMFSNTHHPSKHTHVTVTSKKRGRGREEGREG